MAIGSLLLKTSLNISRISSAVFNTNRKLDQSGKTAAKIGKTLFDRNKRKRETIKQSRLLFFRRRESVRRKEQESIIEASGIGGAIKRQGKVIAESTKGFLGRIMDFVGTLLVGWLLNNLPTIIGLAQELIARIQKFVNIMGSFVNNTIRIFRTFGDTLGAIYTDVTRFELTFPNTRSQVEKSMNELDDAFSQLNNSFDEAFRIFTTPFTTEEGEGAYSEQPVPEAGSRWGGGLPPSESAEMYRIAAALSTEGTGSQSSADMMQVVVNRKATGRYGKTYTDILAAGQSVKRSQFQGVWKRPGGPTEFRKIQTLEDAAKWSGQSKDTLLKIITDIQNPTLQANAAQHVKGALEFRASAVRYPRLSGSAWRGGPGDNQFLLEPSKDPIRKEGAAAFNLPAPVQAQVTPSPGRGVTTTVRDEVNVAGPRGGTATVGRSGGRGEYLARGGRHKGIDIGTSREKGWYVAFKSSGTVTYAQFQEGGYGNLVIIKTGNVEYYFAHLAKIMVKRGPYTGETIGEIGKTGRSYGEHLHFEVRINGKDVNPEPYLKLLSIGRQLTGISGQPAQVSTPTPTPAQVSASTQRRSATPEALTTPRKGPVIIVAPPSPQMPQAPQMIPMQGSSLSLPQETPDSLSLNRYITQKLLLDLAYT